MTEHPALPESGPTGTDGSQKPNDADAIRGAKAGRADAWGRLYDVSSRLAAYLGYHGTVEAKSDLGALLLDALRGIDGDNWCPGLMPAAAPAQPISAENQWFGDMMILQVLADSAQVNEQEREVLTRWLAAAPTQAVEPVRMLTDDEMDAAQDSSDLYCEDCRIRVHEYGRAIQLAFIAANAGPVPMTDAARDVLAEVAKATKKFPTWPTDPLHALAVLGEEFGELTKDMLQLTYEPHKTSAAKVRTEAIQTAAMALRLLMSLERYRYAPCEQHSQDAGRTIPKE